MKLRLVHQLSLLLVACSLLAVLAMGLLTATQLRRGFNDYLRAQDQARLNTFAEAARTALQTHGLARLQDQPYLLDLPPGEGRPPRGRPPRDRFEEGRRPPPEDRAPLRGLALYTPEGQLLWGRPMPPGGKRRALEQAIELDGRTVAVARLMPRPEAPEATDAAFLRDQFLALAGVGAGVMLLATLAAVLLARRWARPLAAAQAATHRLAQGDFTHRLPPSSGRWHDELDDLGMDLNRLAEALQNLEASRRRWVAELAHELRTPLTVLRGELEAVQDGVRPMDGTRIASLHREVQRLNRLADDFSLLARADLNALPCEFAPLPIRPLLLQTQQRWQDRLQHAGLALTLEAPELQLPKADAERLGQVLDNLLSNAMAYTDAPGRVHLWAQRQGAKVLMGVDDSPPGVPDALERERLFEPLYRRAASRQRVDGGGSGLGLSIARAIVLAHGGRLRAEPSPLGGLRVVMELPA